MGRFNYIQNNFLNGEISPKAYGRTDLKEYLQSCREIFNAVPFKQGGAGRRNGSQFIRSTFTNANAATVNFQTKKFRLIPFSVSRTEAYVIWIGTDDPPKCFGLVNTNALSHTQSAIARGAVYASPGYELNHLGDQSGGTGGTTGAYYTEAELKEVQYAQSGDILVIVHPNHVPLVIYRTAADTFKWLEWGASQASAGGPFVGQNTVRQYPFRTVNTNTANTMTLSGVLTVGGAVTATMIDDTFVAGHKGSIWKTTRAGSTGSFIITAITSAKIATGIVTTDCTTVSTVATSAWEESAWSDYRGWPRTVCFFEQRAIFGGNAAERDTVWASQQGDIYEMDAVGYATDSGYGTVEATDPFTLTPAATEVNSMNWLSPAKVLSAGTLGREYNISGPDNSLSFGPTNVSFSPETSHGSAYVQAVRNANALTFVQRAGRSVREFIFNFQEDSFRADDLATYAEHMTKKCYELRGPGSNVPRIINMQLQESASTLWCLDDNGFLLSCLRDRQNGVTAWAFHAIAGRYDDVGVTWTSNYAYVKSIAIVPNATGSSDDIWMLVGRFEHGGTETVYLEKIGSDFIRNELDIPTGVDLSDFDTRPVYMDSAFRGAGGPGTSITGFTHLANKTVGVLVDGNYIGTKTVSAGGVITLDSSGTDVIAGLLYRSIIDPVSVEAGSVIGSANMSMQSIDKAIIRFERTCSAKIGKTPTDPMMEELNFRADDLGAGLPTPPYTGIIERDFPGDWGRESRMAIVCEDALPMNVVSYTLHGVTND